MRLARAAAVALLLLTLPLLSMTAAAQESHSVAVKARGHSYVGDAYEASVVARGDLAEGSLALTITPPLDGLTLLAPSGATCDEATRTCAFDGTVDTVIVTVRGTLTAEAAETADRLQRVEATLTTGSGAALTDAATTRASPRADLSVAVTGTNTAPAGQSATYDVLVANAGPSATPAVVALAGARDQVSIAAPSGASCTERLALGYAGQLCTIDVAAGDLQSLTFTVTALEGEDLPEARSLVALAYPGDSTAGLLRVYYSPLDPRLRDNVAHATLAVPAPVEDTDDETDDSGSSAGTGLGDGTGNAGTGASGTGLGDASGDPSAEDNEDATEAAADVATSLTGPDELMQGLEGTYTLTVVNDGTAAATGLRVQVPLSGAGKFVSAASADGTCSAGRTLATCVFGDLGAGQTATATLVAVGTSPGTLELTAAPSAGIAEAASVSTLVGEPRTDLVFTEFSASPSSVKMGDSVTIRLAVRNDGPAPVRDAFVELPVPDGLNMGDQSRGPCVLSGGSIRCFLGTIGVDATKDVSVTITADAVGDYSATGTASSSIADEDPSDNQQTLRVTVRAL